VLNVFFFIAKMKVKKHARGRSWQLSICSLQNLVEWVNIQYEKLSNEDLE